MVAGCLNGAVWRYACSNYWELGASTLESITLVLVVFVQDIAFKESIVVCAGLLTASFVLHGLAFKAGQCQVWPKVIEMAAPVLFYGLVPAGYLATYPTYRAAFIIINFWFAAVEVIFMVFGRNFIGEYLQDWNPREVWGTPLLQHSARVVAISWIVCQIIMGLAQVFVVAFNISVENDIVAAIMMCYVMQLLPLVWAVAFTFIYPARIKRKWGYVPGVRATCYPPPGLTTGFGIGQSDSGITVITDAPSSQGSKYWQRLLSFKSSKGLVGSWSSGSRQGSAAELDGQVVVSDTDVEASKVRGVGPG